MNVLLYKLIKHKKVFEKRIIEYFFRFSITIENENYLSVMDTKFPKLKELCSSRLG